MFQKMPVILVLIILAVATLGSYIPLEVQQFIYAISLFIKSVIVFLLPIVIFSLLFKVALGLANNAVRIILMILVAVCCSNFISSFLGHFVGEFIYSFDLSLILPQTERILQPTWELNIPTIIPNERAMLAGIILGVLAGIVKSKSVDTAANYLEKIVGVVLKSFVYLIPLFVVGFIVKLQYEGILEIIIRDYALIFITVTIAQYVYVAFLYLVATNFNLSRFVQCIKNMMPAFVAAFSTMSSASVMPLTIIGTEKNAQSENLARSIIPATVNVHMVGTCFTVIIFAYAILKNFGMPAPDLVQYLIFGVFFVITMFSIAGIPGGGILVMFPILQQYFGFNAEMLSLFTALYILFDPITTSSNVMGNGAFALIMEKFRAVKSALAPASSTA
jgi:Na+/H+-dicarboxylate symporter